MKTLSVVSSLSLFCAGAVFVVSELDGMKVKPALFSSLRSLEGGETCYKQDSIKCSGNVTSTSCGSGTCQAAGGFFTCPKPATPFTFPPNPGGVTPTDLRFEIVANSIDVCSRSSSGFALPLDGGFIPCMTVYNCNCVQAGACQRAAFFYNSTDDRQECIAGGEVCPVEQGGGSD